MDYVLLYLMQMTLGIDAVLVVLSTDVIFQIILSVMDSSNLHKGSYIGAISDTRLVLPISMTKHA